MGKECPCNSKRFDGSKLKLSSCFADKLISVQSEKNMAEPVAGIGKTRMYPADNNIKKRILADQLQSENQKLINQFEKDSCNDSQVEPDNQLSNNGSFSKNDYSVAGNQNEDNGELALSGALLRKLIDSKKSPDQLGSMIVKLARQAARLHVDELTKIENIGRCNSNGINNHCTQTVAVWCDEGGIL